MTIRNDSLQLSEAHLEKLRWLLSETLPANPFYAHKLRDCQLQLDSNFSTADFLKIPFTSKAELAEDQFEHPPYGTALSSPIEDYCRLHQTSGTSTGRPLRWLDTNQSWNWLLDCWAKSFPVMGITKADRLFFPFSFGPFLGFWSAFEAATRAGMLCLPGGGMTSTARLRFLLEHEVTIVFATPTYALHLSELAAQEKIDLVKSSVRALVLAGEPGACISTTRQRIEEIWGARVFDHYGMTEIGPVAVEAVSTPGSLMLLEEDYIVEVLEPKGTQPSRPGQVGELVLTNLGRLGSPLIRYRTGDLVRLSIDDQVSPNPHGWRLLQGGVLGRADDMIHVRGNNLYPSAIEAIIRRFSQVAEYRIVVDHSESLTDLRIELEPTRDAPSDLADQVARDIRDELLFRVEVTDVLPGTLPRFEMKARRIHHVHSR